MMRLLARLFSIPAVADWLIERAQKTPYHHLTGYMERWWLFNPRGLNEDTEPRRWPWLPSIRIHHILREDLDKHLHDHPWNARTFILRGEYLECRLIGVDWPRYVIHHRRPGDTAKLRYGEFHKIVKVSDGGVWTLFVMGPKKGTWGFLVDGVKIKWREYLGLEKQ